MSNEPEKNLKDIFTAQKFAVLATSAGDQPFTNIVSFYSTDDFHYMIFFTPVKTSKHERILKNPRISLFIDNRSNRESDVTGATGVTVIGTAVSPDSAAQDKMRRGFIKKHPGLKDFAGSPESAMITIKVERYHIVSSFQDVTVINMDKT